MQNTVPSFVLGQRYAFATLALIVAALSFVNLAGVEKAVLGILLGFRALTLNPEPALEQRRRWAKAAMVLGATQIALLATVILLNLHRLPKVIEVLRALSDVR